MPQQHNPSLDETSSKMDLSVNFEELYPGMCRDRAIVEHNHAFLANGMITEIRKSDAEAQKNYRENAERNVKQREEQWRAEREKRRREQVQQGYQQGQQQGQQQGYQQGQQQNAFGGTGQGYSGTGQGTSSSSSSIWDSDYPPPLPPCSIPEIPAPISETVLEAVFRTRRHDFIMDDHVNRSYVNYSCPIGMNQVITQPSLVANMTHLLLGGEQVCSWIKAICQKISA
jgi:hypothetical protein